MSLSLKHRQVIDFIQSFTARAGHSPTLGDIAEGVGVSKSVAWFRVKSLCDLGLLKKRRYGPRSIEVTKEAYE